MLAVEVVADARLKQSTQVQVAMVAAVRVAELRLLEQVALQTLAVVVVVLEHQQAVPLNTHLAQVVQA
jgi:hypothetical protein